MLFRSIARVLVVFAATAVLAQSGQPGTTAGAPVLPQQALSTRRPPAANKTIDPQGLAVMHQRIDDMASTLTQMRVVLNQMRAKAGNSKSNDSLAKANLDMWSLMVGHLDKELQQLRLTLASREDMEARRAALYKQADAKIEAAAQATRAGQAARFAQAQQNANGTATPAATDQATGQNPDRSPAAQTAPAQPSATATTNNSASPN